MFDLRSCTPKDVVALCERFHAYGSGGNCAVYAFAVYEDSEIVAAYAWQPPPPQAAKSTCPEAPHGVLALSRMVAVPKTQRRLKHVSKPLRAQMRSRIDRTRWPVLITFSDEGAGHTGYVYQCSGWEKTTRRRMPVFTDTTGVRRSSYANGRTGARELVAAGHTLIQRWEHWVCPRGMAAQHMADHGWRRVPVHGKTWKSGNPAFTYVREDTTIRVG